MGEGVLPIIGVIDPSNPAPGSTVNVKVTLQPPGAGGTLTMSGSPAGFFSSLPDEVPVAAGSTQASFTATLSSSASGTGTVSIDGGLGSTQASCVAAADV